MDFYGQLDFTLMCRLWKAQPELFKKIQFKDGEHILLKVRLGERRQPDEHGNTHFLKANHKKGQEKEGVNYYIGSSFKPIDYNNGNTNNSATTSAQQQGGAKTDSENLPF